MVNFEYSCENNNFNVIFKPVTREIDSWPSEIDNTAKLIAKETNKPLFLGLSGGVDSEIIADYLIKNNIPFTALIVKYGDGENFHDFKFAEEYCNKHNIKTYVINLDSVYFYTKTINKYIEKGYRATRIFRYFQLYMLEIVEKMGGCLILGSGEQVYDTIDQEIGMYFEPGYMLPFEWCKKNNTTHYPCFFMHNPEIYAAYMKIDLIKFLLQRPSFFVSSSDNMSVEKTMIYQRYWPNMIRRNKFHGYEKMIDLKNQIEDNLRKLFPDVKPKFFSIKHIKEQLNIL
jgi:hypothetical protein